MSNVFLSILLWLTNFTFHVFPFYACNYIRRKEGTFHTLIYLVHSDIFCRIETLCTFFLHNHPVTFEFICVAKPRDTFSCWLYNEIEDGKKGVWKHKNWHLLKCCKKSCEIETWDSAFTQNLYLMLPHNEHRASIKRNETVKCVNT